MPTKLTGSPAGNIDNWLWERIKVITPNPLKPWDKKEQKEKKIDVSSLNILLKQIVKKINEIIDELGHTHTEYAETEHGHSHTHTAAEASSVPGGAQTHTHGITRRGGKLQRGGRTRPVPTIMEGWKQNQNSG